MRRNEDVIGLSRGGALMPVAVLNLIEVVLNGLMAGVLYALVALGFVLIFKASGSSTMPRG